MSRQPGVPDPTLERDDDLIPIAEVARRRGVKPKTVLELAKRDPRHPPLVAMTDNPRARKFLRRGDNNSYERMKLAEAERRQADRIARNAAKQADQTSHNP